MTKYIKILFIAILLITSTSRVTASIYNPNERCDDPQNPTNLPCIYGNNVPAGAGYQYLAPLPNPDDNGNVQVNIDPSDPAALSKYLNLLIKLFIGICAVLAVIMIVIGGMQYMTTDLASSKEEGTSRIWGAVMGLVLALGSYALLYTINPDILKSDLSSIQTATIQITTDQANFSITEKSQSSVGGNYQTSRPITPGLANFVQTNGSSINSVTINTLNKTANICANTNCVSVPINIGQGGVANVGQGTPGDLKTPKGTTTISGDRRIGNNGIAVTSNNGYNLGAAFINLGIVDSSGNNRGIGIHGSYNDSLGVTNGCIRMGNTDLLTLAPYLKSGLTVKII